jgi:hypothetical protein
MCPNNFTHFEKDRWFLLEKEIDTQMHIEVSECEVCYLFLVSVIHIKMVCYVSLYVSCCEPNRNHTKRLQSVLRVC